MVLTAPQLSSVDHCGGTSLSEGATGMSKPAENSGREVLTLLREGSGRRPRFDAGLAGGMRAWLEDAASELARARGEGAEPLVLGSRALGPETAQLTQVSNDPIGPELITAVLVRALFRQIVLTGLVADPFGDALGALRVEPGREALIRQIEQMAATDRSVLAASLDLHADHLRQLTPRFAPAWLPRTADRIAIPLAGGRVVLSGVFDLLVGAP
ncbi:MAG TPA: hypothetical protein VGH31_12180, partial [Acidimicrobiales bacterium]